jgi:hypothetical protein
LKEEDVAFVHIKDGQYYQISPRYPFIVDNHYFLTIPEPNKTTEPITGSDTIIGALLCMLVLGGICTALAKLKIFEWCREKQKKLLGFERHRGQGDAVGLRVWHQHNWRNSPTPTSSLQDLLSSHYGARNDSTCSLVGENDEVAESAPLLSGTERPVGVSNNSPRTAPSNNGTGVRGLRVPSLSLQVPSDKLLRSEGQRKCSYDFGIFDESSPHKQHTVNGGHDLHSSTHPVMDSSRGILSRTFRSECELNEPSAYATIINFKGISYLPHSSDSYDDHEVDRDSILFVGEDDDLDEVIDRRVAFGMLGLHKGNKLSDNCLSQAPDRPQDGSAGSRLGNAKLGGVGNYSRSYLSKSSPMPSKVNLSAPVYEHQRCFSTEDSIDRLIDQSKHVSADDTKTGFENIDIGKSRRRSAAGVETVDLV